MAFSDVTVWLHTPSRSEKVPNKLRKSSDLGPFRKSSDNVLGRICNSLFRSFFGSLTQFGPNSDPHPEVPKSALFRTFFGAFSEPKKVPKKFRFGVLYFGPPQFCSDLAPNWYQFGMSCQSQFGAFSELFRTQFGAFSDPIWQLFRTQFGTISECLSFRPISVRFGSLVQ